MSIDLSLDRLKELTIHLPPYTRPTIHIAGTNGKGSVSAILTSILLASALPLRVGRYNSPHLVTVLDCITIDNTPVAREVYDQARREVEGADREHGTRLSNFELLTLTALRVFEEQKLDVVVLEVGMGGRLDATNIVPTACILASALTAVDLDHQAFLGDTVAKIAREKAGIARGGRPFVLGRQLHADVAAVVEEVVREAQGFLLPAIVVERDMAILDEGAFSLLSPHYNVSSNSYPGAQHIVAHMPHFPSTPIRATLPLHGAHQLDNLGTALGVIDAVLEHDGHPDLQLRSRITVQTIQEGIRSASWPGRLSFHTLHPADSASLLVLADGAHNRASAETLGAYVESLLLSASSQANSNSNSRSAAPPLPITLVLGLSHSPPKTPADTLAPLLASVLSSAPAKALNIALGVACVPFTAPEGMPWVKPVPAYTMRDALRTLSPGLAEVDIWVAREDGDAREAGSASGGVRLGEGGGGNGALEEALRWAAWRHARLGTEKVGYGGREGEGGVAPGLVVLAGSLYLVADFYRLLRSS